MSAPRNPQSKAPMLALPLAYLTRFVLRFPGAVLGGCLALALLGVCGAIVGVGFRTSRLDLLNPNSAYNQRWTDYLAEFGQQDDVVAIVEGASRDQVIPVVDELAAGIAQEDSLFQHVLYKKDLHRIRSKALHYLPPEELKSIEESLDRVGPVLDGDWSVLSLAGSPATWGGARAREAGDTSASGASSIAPAAASTASRRHPTPQSTAALVYESRRVTDNLWAALDEQHANELATPGFTAPLDQLDDADGGYLLLDEGRMGVVLLHVASNDERFDRGGNALARLRELLDESQARHPEVQVGVTGMPVLESDEMRTSQIDMFQAGLLSLAGVACLLVAGLGGVRFPLVTVATLLLGMAWSFGFLTLTVGHLNILSVSFAVILIGLGIDFGIHYAAQFVQLRATSLSTAEALEETARRVGPGIVTGAVTTAAAFSATALTDFVGVAELGIIAAGGILLCMAAALIALPVMIFMLQRRRPLSTLPLSLPMERVFWPVCRFPGFVLCGGMLVVLIVGSGLPELRYDHNLLNLQSASLESVAWEHKLVERSHRSVWCALSIADSPEELLRRKREFEQLPLVAQTEEIASLLPTPSVDKQAAIARIARRLAVLPDQPPAIPLPPPQELDRQLDQLQRELEAAIATQGPAAELATPPLPRARADAGSAATTGAIAGGRRAASPDGGESSVRRASYTDQANDAVEASGGAASSTASDAMEALRAVIQARRLLQSLPPDECYRRLTGFQQQSAARLLARLKQLRAMADPQPPQKSDVPEGLVARHVGASDRHLLKVYARGSIWDMDDLEQFVRQVESVDARVTGHPIQTYYASRQMQQSYLHAAIYALLAVAAALMLDFRSIRDSLLAMLPMGIGMLLMFGALGLLGIPLNPANMLALPLILGIGIDNGVHVVHDYRRQRGSYRLSRATAVAVVLTSATSVAGFGSIALVAEHQGLRSLGQVLTIGVACCLATSVVFLPALLTLAARRRKKGAVGTRDAEEQHADERNADPTNTYASGSNVAQVVRAPVGDAPSTDAAHLAQAPVADVSTDNATQSRRLRPRRVDVGADLDRHEPPFETRSSHELHEPHPRHEPHARREGSERSGGLVRPRRASRDPSQE